MQHVKHDTFLEDKGFGFYKKRHHLQSQLTLELLSIIVALCFSFFMFMCSVSTVYAYNTYNQHKLTYGVGNYGKDTQHYFITSSASGYASYINTAMSEWVNTTSSMGVTTPISYTKTTTQSSSRMDIYQVSTVNEWWGLTTMYNGSTEVDPFSSNWAWGKIQLDADFSDLSFPMQHRIPFQAYPKLRNCFLKSYFMDYIELLSIVFTDISDFNDPCAFIAAYTDFSSRRRFSSGSCPSR